MLAAANRLGDSSSFREVTRRGSRAAGRSVVTHLQMGDSATGSPIAVPAVGLVVSRAVGNSVVRNRVKRRLRHQVRPLLDRLPPGSRLVVRALPPAATTSSSELAAQLDRCLSKSLDRLQGSGA